MGFCVCLFVFSVFEIMQLSRNPEFYPRIGFVLFCISHPSDLTVDKEGGRDRITEGQSVRWLMVAPSDVFDRGEACWGQELV